MVLAKHRAPKTFLRFIQDIVQQNFPLFFLFIF